MSDKIKMMCISELAVTVPDRIIDMAVGDVVTVHARPAEQKQVLKWIGRLSALRHIELSFHNTENSVVFVREPDAPRDIEKELKDLQPGEGLSFYRPEQFDQIMTLAKNTRMGLKCAIVRDGGIRDRRSLQISRSEEEYW